MDIGEYIFNLNGDAGREVLAEIQYDIAAEHISGECAPGVAGVFSDHANDEREHRKKIYGLIIARGGKISTDVPPIFTSQINNALYAQNKVAEKEAIARYNQRIIEARSLGFEDRKSVV